MKPSWAPKVPRSLVSRLYAADAQGLLDEDLVFEVGWGLWQRCAAILEVTAAHYGRVRCLQCGEMIERREAWSEGEQVLCPSCGWRIAWADYHHSYQGKQLFGANSVENFESYHRDFPKTAALPEKMLLIDQLIHSFHLSLQGVGRPAASNLLEGSLKEVIQFLDHLSSGTASASGLGDSRSTWRVTMDKADWAKPFLEGE